jgi:diaminopropionate ammonia-lyase
VVSDDWAMAAMRSLASAGIAAGETGAAALAGLQSIASGPAGAQARSALRLGPDSRVLVLCTEGITDTAAWTAITGHPLPEAARPDPIPGGNA